MNHELKPHEIRLIQFIQKRQQEILSGYISTLANERLNYKVTDKTQFSLSEDLKNLTITEPENDRND